MTTREPITTRLIVEFIAPLYEMQEGDILALQLQLTQQVQIEYVKEVQRNLNEYGCQKIASLADAQSIKWIEGYTQKTAEGIANTYNTQLKNQISRMYLANPRGNRYYYLKGLDEWTQRRNSYKISSIALNTMTEARSYAQDRFIRENKIGGRFAPVGPPPVCIKCVRIFAKGPLTWEECQKPQNYLPAHPGCPHKRRALVPTKIECGDQTWTG